MAHVVARRQRQPILLGDGAQRAVEPLLIDVEMALQIDVEAIGKQRLQAPHDALDERAVAAAPGDGERPLPSPGEADQTVRQTVEIGPARHRLALGGAQLALRDQPAEIAIPQPAGGENVERRGTNRSNRIDTVDPQRASDERPHPGAHGGLMKARRPIEPVAIAQRQSRVPQRRRPLDQILRQRRPRQKAERATSPQLGIVKFLHHRDTEGTEDSRRKNDWFSR